MLPDIVIKKKEIIQKWRIYKFGGFHECEIDSHIYIERREIFSKNNRSNGGILIFTMLITFMCILITLILTHNEDMILPTCAAFNVFIAIIDLD